MRRAHRSACAALSSSTDSSRALRKYVNDEAANRAPMMDGGASSDVEGVSQKRGLELHDLARGLEHLPGGVALFLVHGHAASSRSIARERPAGEDVA